VKFFGTDRVVTNNPTRQRLLVSAFDKFHQLSRGTFYMLVGFRFTVVSGLTDDVPFLPVKRPLKPVVFSRSMPRTPSVPSPDTVSGPSLPVGVNLSTCSPFIRVSDFDDVPIQPVKRPSKPVVLLRSMLPIPSVPTPDTVSGSSLPVSVNLSTGSLSVRASDSVSVPVPIVTTGLPIVCGLPALPVPVRRLRGMVGLVNLGNTCWLNSIVQCLCSTPQLVTYFQGSVNRVLFPTRRPARRSLFPRRGTLAIEFGSLLRNMTMMADHSLLNPVGLKIALQTMFPRFQGTRQQDAAEALQLILDALHDDLNQALPVNPLFVSYVEGETDMVKSERLWTSYLGRNASVIVDVFAGQIRSTVTCGNCTDRRTQFEEFLLFPLTISQSSSLVECFLEFTTQVLFSISCTLCMYLNMC
jgi:hypothetical protein